MAPQTAIIANNCYANGEFTTPGLTLEEMKEHLMKHMEKEKLPEDIIEIAISRLLFLKRWSNNKTSGEFIGA